MSLSTHTYGHDCRLGVEPTCSASSSELEIPKLKIQYFYSSPLPIDDPLSVIPSASSADAKAVKHVLRPFSAEDNEALEKAWQNITSGDEKTRKNSEPLCTASKDITNPSHHDINQNKKCQNVDEFEQTAICREENVIKSNKPVVISMRSSDYENLDEPTLKDAESIPNFKSSDSKIFASGNNVLLSHGDQLLKRAGQERNTNYKEDSKFDKVSKIGSHPKHHSQNSVNDARLDSLRLQDSVDSFFKDRVKYCIRCFPMQNYEAEFETKSSDRLNSENTQTPNNFGGKFEADDMEKRPSSILLPSNLPADTLESQLNEISQSCTLDLNVSEKNSNPEDKLALTVSKLPKHNFEIKPGSSLKSSTTLCSHFDRSQDFGTTGRPFVKLESRPCSPSKTWQDANDGQETNKSEEQHTKNPRNFTERYEDEGNAGSKSGTTSASKIKSQRETNTYLEVPVGVSKLHLVELPILQMKPIYWSPVHDMASVIRGTWFFKENMYPVEPAISNQLELGYCKLKPWTQTWKDELESALVAGALGEEKIVHRLWPKEKEGASTKKLSGYFNCRFSSNQSCVKGYLHGEVAAEGIIGFEIDDQNLSSPDSVTKKYSTAQIIYKDSRHAFILKPSLQPSAYYGRKPLQKIKKGITVGIPVIRGFDWKAWDQLHPSKKMSTKMEGPSIAAWNQDSSMKKVCSACMSQQTQVKTTDLVLIVHGIGQKLSERVESFNFTHAVNDFRRSMNAELYNNSYVKRVLRKNWGGMMVLPVNWRSNLSFEDGGLMKSGDLNRQNLDYSLPDVTQESLPAVRRMISDVMLDIPYYMSHHKPKMIQAVVQEANRVYRLWCKNNPDFEEKGRVHLIAHSLGSVMVMEILSKQPTIIPKLNLLSSEINTMNFDFKTTNCFFVGSPAGFFLLLEQKNIHPRRGLVKPDAEGFDDEGITGNAGDFGCMVVDNLYNVMHYNDPIAYRLNSTVDRKYAESLREAQLPSATTGIFESLGKAIRSFAPGITPAQEMIPVGQDCKVSSMAHLPSSLEMEVHDFTREESAEKKFNLLNDNGQIDWYMNSGRGPLEIQYLNMLGAHSSYWTNPDFVRIVVVECGREPGKNSTLPSMRAAKFTRIGKLNDRK
ncbi:hypothetical protein K3495_g936 [Podosphaera aphanis]|nr:hypothetical protein K3495_g936 [Podosphaera aphanis]